MRVICLAVLLAGVAPVAFSQIAAPKADSTPELRKAVEELAHPRFAVREKASKRLWEGGRSAEPLLREAAKSADEETATRAKSILEKFDWGIYPDTPAETVKLIELFRGGDAAARQDVLGKMMLLRPTAFATLRKLITHETNAEQREQMFVRLAFQARVAVPELIVTGQLDEAGELLEICSAKNSRTAMGDFATFVHFRKQVEPTIARLEKQLATQKGTDLVRTHETLTHLYRVQKDWAKAAKAAKAADNKDLIDAVAWESNDWKTLATNPVNETVDSADHRGLMAAYHRMAGDKAKYDETIAALRKELTGIEGDDFLAAEVAQTLMLNGEGGEAVKLLKDRPGAASTHVFDLLCAQMKFREAFAFADKALKEMEKEENHEELQQLLNFRRLVVLAGLGEMDAATQLSRKLLDHMNAKPDRAALLSVYVKDLVRANQRELALEFAALAATFAGSQRDDRVEMTALFSHLYPGDEVVVYCWWWDVMRAEEGYKDTAGQLRRIEKLAAGKGAARDVAAIEKRLDEPKPNGGSMAIRQYAVAELHRRHGDAKKADAAFRRAIATHPDPLPKVKPADDVEPDVDSSADHADRILLAYGDFLMKEGRFKEAAAIYARVWKAEPDAALPLFLKGQALVKAGDDKAGKAVIELAHWVPLGDERARAHFCEELTKRGYDEDSKREMQLILDTGWFRSYEVGNMHLRMARRLARQKEYAKAAQYYEKDVISLFRTGASFQEPRAYLTVPELARTYRLRAMLAAGKTEDALKEAKQSLDILPGNVELAIDFVPELERAGRKKEADALYAQVRDTYAAAIKDFGSSADLRNSVAWVMVNCNRDLDEAKKHAEKAVALKPDAAGYIDTLAEVHFRLKDRPKALELMKKCAAIEPKNPYYRKQLERFEKKPFDSPTPDEETGDD